MKKYSKLLYSKTGEVVWVKIFRPFVCQLDRSCKGLVACKSWDVIAFVQIVITRPLSNESYKKRLQK